MIPATDSTSNFTGLEVASLPLYWDRLCKLLELPLKRTNAEKYYTPDDVLWKCVDKKWQCWIAWEGDEIDCVFITYITQYPTGYRTFAVYLVGGNKIDTWLSTAWNTFKDYAKSVDCKEITGMGRKGWLRKLKEVEDNPLEEHLRFSVEL